MMATDGPPAPPESLPENALGAAGTAPPSVGGTSTGPGGGPCGIDGTSPAAGASGASTGGIGTPLSELPGGGGGNCGGGGGGGPPGGRGVAGGCPGLARG